MDYVRLATEEAKRLARECEIELKLRISSPQQTVYNEHLRFLQRRRERYYRRLTAYVTEFGGLPLRTGRRLLVENSGSAIVFPCIRLMEEVVFGERGGVLLDCVEKQPLVDVSVEITDDGDLSRVQCRAEYLWLEPTLRVTSSDPENLMRYLACKVAHLLKVDEVLRADEEPS